MKELEKKISKKALTVWRVTYFLIFLILLLVGIGLAFISFHFHWSNWIVSLIVFLLILYIVLAIIFIPFIRWRRWRYEVRDLEIELQRGVIFIKRTLIPMARVQHVDMKQGPILRKYRLATITITTAATKHEIPALDMEEADELRLSISRLARVAKDDV